MTRRERVLTALNHKTPDKIPCDFGVGKACYFHKGFYVKLLDYFGIREDVVLSQKASQLAIASDAVLAKLDGDVRCGWPFFAGNTSSVAHHGSALKKEWEDDEYYYMIDGWGTTCQMKKIDGLYYDMCKPPLEGADESEDAKYQWPPVPQANPEGLAKAKKYKEEGFAVSFMQHYGNGFLQNGARIYGYFDWLAMLAGEEKRVHKILDKLLERKMQFFDNLIEVYGDTADIFAEQDDMGMQTAPFISLEMFRRYMKPRWKELFTHIKKKWNGKILFHSDGAMSVFIPDLIECGVDILNPLQYNCPGMELERIKKEFGKDLCFWGGGIESQFYLPFGTVEQVRDEVRRTMDILRKDGGWVFSAVQCVQPVTPIENFMAMLETFMENRDY